MNTECWPGVARPRGELDRPCAHPGCSNAGSIHWSRARMHPDGEIVDAISDAMWCPNHYQQGRIRRP